MTRSDLGALLTDTRPKDEFFAAQSQSPFSPADTPLAAVTKLAFKA
jgi:hypothetical protein